MGVNLDSLLRPSTVGVVSLNDKEFTDSGILKKFMRFANNDSELHNGNDVSGFVHFHPANPMTGKLGFGQMVIGAQNDVNQIYDSEVTGADPLSDALKKVVTDILRRTVNEIKSILHKYINVNGYSLVALMPEIVFYVRFAEFCDKIKAKGLPLCKAKVIDREERNCNIKDIYNIKLGVKAVEGDNSEIVTNHFAFMRISEFIF